MTLILVALSLDETRKHRSQMSCIMHLKQLDGVSQAWALENKKAMTDTYSLSDTTMLDRLHKSCSVAGV